MPQSDHVSNILAIAQTDGASPGIEHQLNRSIASVASQIPPPSDYANERATPRAQPVVFNTMATSGAMVTNVAGDYYTYESIDEQALPIRVRSLLAFIFAESVACNIVYPNSSIVMKIIRSPTYRSPTYHDTEFIPAIISAIAALQWGRFSDRYGRKPILLINMGGFAIAIVCIGLSESFPALVLSNAIAGFFRASLPTIKAAVAESSDESRMAFVFSLLPVMQGTGAYMNVYIEIFLRVNRINADSCLPAALLSGMLCVASFYSVAKLYQETLPSVGDHNQPLIITIDDADDTVPLSDHVREESQDRADHDQPLIITADDTDDTDDIIPLLDYAHEESQDRATEFVNPESFSKKELWAFLTVLGNYAIFTLLAVSFYPTFTMFFTSLGLLDPALVMNITAVSGGLHAIIQVYFFARAHKRWGPHKIYKCAAVAFIPTYAAMPVMGMLVGRAGHITPLVVAILVLQQIACSLIVAGFACMSIFIAKATPSPRMLGRTNGLAQMVHIAMSAISPAVLVFISPLYRGYVRSGITLAWLIQGLLGFLVVGLSFTLP